MRKYLLLSFLMTMGIISINAQKTLNWNIYFDYDKAEIRSAEYPVLKQILDSVNQKSVKIYLIGNTDADGSDKYNQALSERRAQSVKSFLIAQGVSDSNFYSLYYGEVIPVADNITEEGKQKNRRVEVTVIFNTPSVQTLVNTSQKSEKSIPPPITIQRFLEESTKDNMQTYLIRSSNTEQMNVLAKEGTILSFPSNLFDVPENTDLVVSIKEAYSMSDIFFQNLSTHADNDEMLITGGMIYVDVKTKNGKSLKPTKKYRLMMPRQKKETLPFDESDIKYNRKNPVQLWVAKKDTKGNEVWGLPAQSSIGLYQKIERLKRIIDTAQNYYNWISDTCGCNKMFVWSKDSVISTKKVQGKIIKEKENLFHIGDVRPKGYHFVKVNEDTKLSPLCAHLKDWAIQNQFQGMEWQKIHWLEEMSLNNNENDYAFYNINRLKESSKIPKKPSFWNTLMGQKSEKSNKTSKIVAFTQLQIEALNNLSYLKSLKYSWEEDEVKYKQMMAELKVDSNSLSKIEKAQYTIFETQELGSINCDFFAKMGERVLVNAGTNIQNSPFNMAKMIFKNRKVVMNANFTDGKTMGFGRIPQGEEAVIVAMKIQDGQPYFAMQSVKLENKQYNLAFEPLSMDKVKEKLKLLD